MLIENQFSDKQIPILALKIHDLIKGEPRLTYRPLKDIKKLLGDGSFYVATDTNRQVLGFIAAEKVVGNFVELKSWYVVPKKRGSGLAERIFLKSIENKQQKYFCNTFQLSIVNRLKTYGFRKITLFDLPLSVLVRYVLTRPPGSILRHFLSQKSVLLTT